MNLSPGWWNDRLVAEEVWRQARALIRDGHSDPDIARRLGISSRSVLRYRKARDIPAVGVGGGPRDQTTRKWVGA